MVKAETERVPAPPTSWPGPICAHSALRREKGARQKEQGSAKERESHGKSAKGEGKKEISLQVGPGKTITRQQESNAFYTEKEQGNPEGWE